MGVGETKKSVVLLRRYGLLLCLAGLVFVGACGTSETTYPDPNNTNPYSEAQVGTDTTLDIATWNLENYAKNGSTTVELVRQAMLGMDVDIIALQEIEYSAGFRDLYRGIEGWDGYRAEDASYDINLAFLYKTGGSLDVTSIHEILVEYGREFPAQAAGPGSGVQRAPLCRHRQSPEVLRKQRTGRGQPLGRGNPSP